VDRKETRQRKLDASDLAPPKKKERGKAETWNRARGENGEPRGSSDIRAPS